jgi:hypothetical protein
MSAVRTNRGTEKIIVDLGLELARGRGRAWRRRGRWCWRPALQLIQALFSALDGFLLLLDLCIELLATLRDFRELAALRLL